MLSVLKIVALENVHFLKFYQFLRLFSSKTNLLSPEIDSSFNLTCCLGSLRNLLRLFFLKKRLFQKLFPVMKLLKKTNSKSFKKRIFPKAFGKIHCFWESQFFEFFTVLFRNFITENGFFYKTKGETDYAGKL